MQKQTPKTQEQARQYAIDWQNWASENKMYMSELIEWQQIFLDLAINFGLVAEFEENGII
jgi:hypothetical protein